MSFTTWLRLYSYTNLYLVSGENIKKKTTTLCLGCGRKWGEREREVDKRTANRCVWEREIVGYYQQQRDASERECVREIETDETHVIVSYNVREFLNHCIFRIAAIHSSFWMHHPKPHILNMYLLDIKLNFIPLSLWNYSTLIRMISFCALSLLFVRAFFVQNFTT